MVCSYATLTAWLCVLRGLPLSNLPRLAHLQQICPNQSLGERWHRSARLAYLSHILHRSKPGRLASPLIRIECYLREKINVTSNTDCVT
nr:MAG TPA: hypothetical protein [Caudoviricetes sp.]